MKACCVLYGKMRVGGEHRAVVGLFRAGSVHRFSGTV